MPQLSIDIEAGELSAELVRRGVPAHTRVHVLVEIMDTQDLPIAAIAQAGHAFDWLADEPDLYTDADLVERAMEVFTLRDNLRPALAAPQEARTRPAGRCSAARP